MAIVKPAKLPALSANTTLLSFDLETNGLHGNAFAIGAVLMDAKGHMLEKFTGRCDISGEIDEWVKINVLPAISDLNINYDSAKDLREAFWEWYLQTEPKADYVVVSNGYPVEYRFLLQCQEENLAERYWQHPFPILDLTSLLLASGHDPSGKSSLINRIVREGGYKRHHPLHDAKIAILAAFEALSPKG